MNKLILSLLFLVPGAMHAAENAFEPNDWQPNEKFLSLLDRCYEDKNHPEVKSTSDNLNNFLVDIINSDLSLSQKEKEQQEKIINGYTHYLGIYLVCAQQLLMEDKAIADYANTVDIKPYLEDFMNETLESEEGQLYMMLIKQSLPEDLFMLWILFIYDEHFQKEVEKYTEQIMVTYYSK